ncbi:uncharacterized protein EDB91DRAFT_1336244 [Suillus paluster]|uniref:uncharacterized protein n=1 Tax=Suillus paluster TaxID=48578 RepID=UPI001B863898|nr:uncharacterized protein EDB91DRAFT_1336244 [Suillus paluster]KAG1741880.1 hypothetical protein EDB91DRAFT_1336244 [Suillus paluster]
MPEFEVRSFDFNASRPVMIDWVITNVSQEDCECEGSIGGQPAPPAEVPKVGPEDFPNVVTASANILAGDLITRLVVKTTDGHSGGGWSLNVRGALDLTKGMLGYSSWDELESDTNTYVIADGDDTVTITFLVHGSPKAAFSSGGTGKSVLAGYGQFAWE